jgi:DNA-directed RNA polymerase subunit RPC12/RpoP
VLCPQSKLASEGIAMMNSNAQGSSLQSETKVMRCPYCVERGMFKEMTVGDAQDWRICARCGHLARALTPAYECTCAQCVKLRITQ